MSGKALLILLIALALGIFVAANWTAFNTPTTLSLIVATIEAPLGVVMLGVVAFAAAVFLAYAFWLQASGLRETRRLYRDIEAQREVAESAEASRLKELQISLEARLDALASSCAAIETALQRWDRPVAAGTREPVAVLPSTRSPSDTPDMR